MKLFLSLLALVVVSTAVQAQNSTFAFSGKTYAMPADFKSAGTINTIQSTDGSTIFSWSYFPDAQRAKIRMESLAGMMEEQMKSFKKDVVTAYLGGQEAMTLKITYETKDGVKGYRLLSSGLVNNQAVLVELWSFEEVKTNQDIPAGIRDIIAITK